MSDRKERVEEVVTEYQHKSLQTDLHRAAKIIDEQQTEIERLQQTLNAWNITHTDEVNALQEEIERLKERNALLEDVAAAAEEFDKVLYGGSRKWAAVMSALGKLREVSGE